MLYRGIDRRLIVRRSPSASAGPFDMLKWCLLQTPGYHLEGNANKLYSNLLTDRFFWTKSQSGFPWDVELYDSQFIYHWATEYDWVNPKNFKATAKRTTIPFAYRFAYDGDIVVASDTTINVVLNCAVNRSFNLGRVQCETHFVGPKNWLGDLPNNLDTVEVCYRWSGQPDGTFKVMETYSLAFPYGLVQWKTQNWNYTTRQYSLPSNVSNFNLLRPGIVMPRFPCAG